MFSEFYVRVILATAPWVVCLAFSLETDYWSRRNGLFCCLAGLLFSASVVADPLRVWGALPWLVLTLVRAAQALARFVEERNFSSARWGWLASLLYLPVGAIWAIFDQLQFRPLEFSAIIVLLTGVHFHYAGFALPRLTSLWLEQAEPTRPILVTAWGIFLGVPLVAIGITTSQLSMPAAIEVVAVTILAVSAFTLSISQFHWALKTPLPPVARGLFLLGGLALAAGMVLATIYGWRSVYPIAWATIPAMYAFHGTLNSLGFCLPGFVAWKLFVLEHRRSGDSAQ